MNKPRKHLVIYLFCQNIHLDNQKQHKHDNHHSEDDGDSDGDDDEHGKQQEHCAVNG